MSRKTVKTSISLSGVVHAWAEELCKKKGYDNFSAYIAELIRRDQEREEERQQSRSRAVHPAPRPERIVLEDKPKKTKTA